MRELSGFPHSEEVAVDRLRGVWGSHHSLLFYICFAMTAGPADLRRLKPTIRCLDVITERQSYSTKTASHRPLALCHLSFRKLLDQTSSHGGGRVLTGQAPVWKDLLRAYPTLLTFRWPRQPPPNTVSVGKER